MTDYRVGAENRPRYMAATPLVELDLGPRGRALVRPSGTEPKLKIYVDLVADRDGALAAEAQESQRVAEAEGADQAVEHGAQVTDQGGQPVAVGEFDVLLHEVQLELHQAGEVHELLPQPGNAVADAAAQLAHGHVVGAGGIGGDEVGPAAHEQHATLLPEGPVVKDPRLVAEHGHPGHAFHAARQHQDERSRGAGQPACLSKHAPVFREY